MYNGMGVHNRHMYIQWEGIYDMCAHVSNYIYTHI